MKTARKEGLHILYLIDVLYKSGGTEKHLLDLVHGMTERGHTVSVICFNEGEFGAAFRKLPQIEFHCFNIKRIYDLSGISAFQRLLWFISRRSVDIVQTFHTASDLLGPLAARLAIGKPLVFSSRRDTGHTKEPRHIWMQKLINRLVDRVLINSNAVGDAVCIREGLPRERLHLIYNGIHVERYRNCSEEHRQSFRKTYKIPANRFIVGSIGNIRPVKGYETMVETAALLCRQHADIHFLHAGFGDQLQELEELCKRFSISEQFRFLGSIDQVPEFLSCLDAYLQPSLSEGFSNSILEAMSVGLPVVATSVGGNVEAIQDGLTGFLVEPGNWNSMASALELLINDRALAKLVGRRASTHVNNAFTVERMLGNYEAFYRHAAQLQRGTTLDQ